MSGLARIASKEPIVATFDTQTLHTSVTTVRDAYVFHALTYVEQPDVADFRQRFVQAVHQAQTPKACIVAPFGYGKTATAIGLWDACQQSGLLAVPPISCSSFAELAQALFDWSVFKLPDYHQELHAAYDAFLTLSADSMARRDEQKFQIPFAVARAAIKDKIERGYLDFEDISVNLVSFLEIVTALTLRTGYQGLVVIVDEIQQLIGNANKGVLVALRQLIWGLRTRQIAFGILLTMDPDTERILADRAGDILHRIKDDNLYLDMRHIYDRDFPARLWQQYQMAFHLSHAEATAIDHATLEALGQIGEREDLSNGPRTVINVLQRVAVHATDSKAPYTPIDLMNDFLNGAIRFDGDRGIIPALVGELLSFPYFQRSHSLAQALRLIAAFPRGCPEQLARKYNLEQAWHELNDDLRGEIVTELEEGLTLIELQRVGRPAHRLNVLLRRYWMQITDQQLFAETSLKVFSNIVLPLIFPPKVHDLSGWKVLEDILLDANDHYTGLIEGTSSSRYPLRRLRIVVLSGQTPNPVTYAADDVDLVLRFRLDMHSESMSQIAVISDSYIEFHLVPGCRSEKGLQGGLAWIEHYLSPHPISASMILSLLNYLHQEQTNDVPERDQARMTDTIARLQEWLLAELFPQELFNTRSFHVIAAGASGLKEFLHLVFSNRWQNYQPIATYQHWAALLDDYEVALKNVPPEQRIGSALQTGTKAEIAQLFRQQRHAGFESRARQYGLLLRIAEWKGTQAAVQFIPHPAEFDLANLIRTHGRMSQESAYSYLRGCGFAATEVTYLLRLMLIRGLAQQDGTILVTPELPTIMELRTRATNLQTRCAQIPDIADAVSTEIETLIQALEQQEETTRSAWNLQRLEQQVDAHEAQSRVEAANRQRIARQHLLEMLPRLTLADPDMLLGNLEKHVMAVYHKLEQQRQTLLAEAQHLTSSSNECVPSQVAALIRRVEQWEGSAHLYTRWNCFAPRLAKLQIAVQRLLSGDDKLKELNQQLDNLLHAAREVLARTGMVALDDISRFEPGLDSCEQAFQRMAHIRQAAYEQIADQLGQQLQKVLTLTHLPALPSYRPEDDEGSFQNLFRQLAVTASRTIAIKRLLFVRTDVTDKDRACHTKICAKIQHVAQQAADPNWLIASIPPRLQPGVLKELENLHKQIEREAQHVSSARRYLINSLSVSPMASVDATMLLDQTNDELNYEQVLKELMQLQQARILRLTIDYQEGNE